MQRQYKFTANGKEWELRFTSKIPKGEYGYCPPPDAKDRHVAINSRLKTDAMFSTIVHEIVHAINWRAPEQTVEQIGTVVAELMLRPDILERLNLRRIK